MMRSLSPRAFAIIAAASLLLGAHWIAAAQEENPFRGHSDTGEILHVLPAPAAIHSPRDTGPTMAPAGDAPSVYQASYGSGPLLNHGGAVISNAGFWALYWNSSVANATATSVNQTTGTKYATLRDQMDAFLTSFGNGAPYSQAPTDDFAIVQQYGTGISSTVHYWGYKVANEKTKSSISDSAIRSFIAAQFNSGAVPPSSSIIYGVYMPPKMKVTMSGGGSCSSFCGYHGHFNYGGLDIRYAVFPYLDCSACKLSSLTVADMMTIVASHEIREAVTDPMLNAWYDKAGYEADDKCAWYNLYRMANGGFVVQPEFSNGGGSSPVGVAYPGPGCVVP
jgi:hypothetical protein